jgi:hypothetical protein
VRTATRSGSFCLTWCFADTSVVVDMRCCDSRRRDVDAKPMDPLALEEEGTVLGIRHKSETRPDSAAHPWPVSKTTTSLNAV